MKQFTIFLFLLACGFAEAQNTVYESSKDALNFGAAKVSRNGGIMYGFDNEPVELEGSSYADSTWKQGSFIFYPTEKGLNKKSDTVHGFTLRYDVHKAEVDILHKNKCFAATTDMLKGFFYKENIKVASHYFVNMNDYKGEVEDLKGFAEVLSNGRMKLFKYYSTALKNPDFNPALNVGSKNYKLVHKTQYYFGTGKILQKLDSGKAAYIAEQAFSNRSGVMQEYAKKQGLNTKKEEDLIKMFDYYNQLQ
jgi:hypothetical protein